MPMYEVIRDGMPKGASLGDSGFIYLDWGISSEIRVVPLSPGYTSMYFVVDINRRGIR